MNSTIRLIRADDGASLVEYSLLVVLIAVVAISAIRLVGGEVANLYDLISVAFPGSSPS